MDLADVQELVGHTSAKTTARYAMVSAPKLMTAQAALDTAWERAKANVGNAWQSRVAVPRGRRCNWRQEDGLGPTSGQTQEHDPYRCRILALCPPADTLSGSEPVRVVDLRRGAP